MHSRDQLCTGGGDRDGNAWTATLPFEARPVLSVTVGGNRLGERAHLPESLIMPLRIWDGGCVGTSSFAFFRNWVQVASFWSPVREAVVVRTSQQMLVWTLLSLLVMVT